MDLVLKHARDHTQRHISLLQELGSLPTISNSAAFAPYMKQAAKWLRGQLLDLGCQEAEILPTHGHPIVFAKLRCPSPNRPTLLVYGHYDVQPVEDEKCWKTNAFSPERRGDRLFGRGISDMKGQIIAILAALHAYRSAGEIPLNIEFIIEGEEEIGSPHLAGALKELADRLEAETVLNLDAGFLAPDLPTICYGLRGIASFELVVEGPSTNLHSGVFGGVVHNPVQALASVLGGLINPAGMVQIPGFYQDVRPLENAERRMLSSLPLDARYYLERTGVPELWGEPDYSPLERVVARPTLEINGIAGGYDGPGEMAIIPSRAGAKITTRLVPDQEPDAVHSQLLSYLRSNMPSTVRWQLHYYGGIKPYLADRSSAEYAAFARSLEHAFNRKAIYIRDGGTIAAAVLMKEILGLDSILSGFGLPTDNIHAPNEHIHLPTWQKGIDALVLFMAELGEMRTKEKAIG